MQHGSKGCFTEERGGYKLKAKTRLQAIFIYGKAIWFMGCLLRLKKTTLRTVQKKKEWICPIQVLYTPHKMIHCLVFTLFDSAGRHNSAVQLCSSDYRLARATPPFAVRLFTLVIVSQFPLDDRSSLPSHITKVTYSYVSKSKSPWPDRIVFLLHLVQRDSPGVNMDHRCWKFWST